MDKELLEKTKLYLEVLKAKGGINNLDIRRVKKILSFENIEKGVQND